jgi:1,4-alpha-glucan branching enzyme
MDRNSAWARYSVQNMNTYLYDSVYWDPPTKFKWTHEKPVPLETTESIRIYEAHVGMAQEFERVSSYRDFADYNLERIVAAGYNTIQLMAIQEHSYYASFGYHVTSFFSVSSRSGTPDDFKYMVDKAHEKGLRVVIDFIHSHASSNVNDGIKLFDGSDFCYSHAGDRGHHT